ncbi:hypothetical protein [Pseudooctadecabacter jejudonensis]|nr:hypothetical protein [Pseudooctadecabacter jejudonensis]
MMSGFGINRPCFVPGPEKIGIRYWTDIDPDDLNTTVSAVVSELEIAAPD